MSIPLDPYWSRSWITQLIIPTKRYSVDITIGGNSVNVGTHYSYTRANSNTTAAIVIYGEYITGDIVIDLTAVANEYTITFSLEGGTGGTGYVTATYDEPLPAINIPSRTGYTFDGYYTETRGRGDRYYDENGSSVLETYAVTDNITLYADWTVHRYLVSYDPNKPDEPGHSSSAEVVGSTESTLHQYDTSSALAGIGFTLTGWHFIGWSLSPSGDEIIDAAYNLTAEDLDEVTVYAIWEPNTYTVIYDSDRPDNASSDVLETMENQILTYDTEAELTRNEFYLTGWTFTGWATTLGGEVAYSDGVSVSNLTAVANGNVTLYAVWTANEYSVVFYRNEPENASGNVTGTMDNQSFTYDGGAEPLTRNAYTLTGWTFTGWAVMSGGVVRFNDGEPVENLADYDGATVRLYAVWTANSYTVNYDPNKPATASGEIGGSTSPSSHVYDTSSALTANGFTLTGWTFTGWSLSVNGATVTNAYNLTETDGGSFTVYAIWEANTYTVTYNGNRPGDAGSVVVGNTSPSSHTYDTESALTTNGFSLTGWTFTGWATASDGTNMYSDGALVENLSDIDGSSVELFAVWTANEYTVVFNANRPANASNEVSGEMAEQPFTYDEGEKELDENLYSLIGWTFRGWATSAGGIVTYYGGALVENLSATHGASVELYAVWTANEYIITFDPEGGSGRGTETAVFDSSLPAITEPFKTGYVFAGYFTEAGGSGTKYYNDDGSAYLERYSVDGNITLHAAWNAITYRIEFYSMGEYVGESENVTYGELLLPGPDSLSLNRPNYDFVGWNIYDEQNWSMYAADRVYNAGLTTEQGATVTLYAAWQEKPVHTLFYDASGGTGAPSMTGIHEGESVPLSEAAPTRERYSFLGWATAPGASEAEYAPGSVFTMGTENVTLYAVWRLNPTLSYDAGEGKFGVVAPAAEYIAPDAVVTITSLIPERTGYVFSGWSYHDLNAASVMEPGYSSFIMPETDTVLTAVWERETYEVTVSAAEGYFAVGLNASYKYEEAAIFTVNGTEPIVYVNGAELEAVDGEYSFTVLGDSTVSITDGTKLTIIYSANGGYSAPVDTNGYESGASATVSNGKPVRTGYEFNGWATTAGATVPEYTAGETIAVSSENVILYAVWKAHTYTVNYNAAGGTGTMDADTFSYGTADVLTSSSFYMEGFTFTGWALEEGGSVVFEDGAEIENLTAADGAVIELHAVWEATVTVITLISDGSEVSEIEIAYGAALDVSSLSAPIRTGYIFNGYYTDENGSGNMIITAAMAPAEPYDNAVWDINETALNVYAAWSPIEYSVVYVLGGTELSSETYLYDETVTLASALELGVTAEYGYVFAGWSLSSGGAFATYADMQTISVPLAEDNGARVLLYAVFDERDPVAVTFNANGGSNAPVISAPYAGEYVEIPAIIPEKEGYVFSGWSFDPASESVDFAYIDGAFDPEGFTANEALTLYAVWTPGETLQMQIDSVNSALDGLSGTMSTNFGSVSESIASLSSSLATAQNAIDELESSYATDEELTEARDTLNSLISEAEGRLAQDISALRSSLETAVGDITELQTALTEAQNTLAAINADHITNAALQSALEGLEGTLTESITAVGNKLSAAVERIDTAEGDISELETALTAAEATLATINADYVTSDALTSALNDLQSTLSESITDINDDLNGALNRLTTAEGSITDLSDEMAIAAAAIEALQTADSNTASALSTLETTLSRAIDELESDLGAKYAELSGLIGGNSTNIADLNSAIDEINRTYKAADEVINGLIDALESEDSELKTSLDNIRTTLDEVNEDLGARITETESRLGSRIEELEASMGSDLTDVDEVIEALRLDCNTADALLRVDFGAADETLANRISALEAASEAADIALKAAIEEVRQRKNELEDENAALSDRIEAEINENATFRDSVLKLVPAIIAISCAVLVFVLIIVACAVRSVKKAARSKSIIKRRD